MSTVWKGLDLFGSDCQNLLTAKILRKGNYINALTLRALCIPEFSGADNPLRAVKNIFLKLSIKELDD
jgi:hypothetical protein